MTRVVYACDDCGTEAAWDAETCDGCGGEVVRVSPVLVASIDAIEAVLGMARERLRQDAASETTT